MFEWSATANSLPVTEILLTFYIDCSLIPPNGSWFLRQTWMVNQIPIVTSSPISSSLLYPKLVPLLVQQPVQGSFGQQGVNMVFVYTNSGSAPLNMDLVFEDMSSCLGTGYNITNVSYQVNGSVPSGNYTTFGNPTLYNLTTSLMPGEFLYIQETINIIGCVIPCSTSVSLKWNCSGLPPGSCPQCDPILNTVFTFNVEIPTFEITRESPVDYTDAYYDNNCPGDPSGTTWTVKVKNTSNFATIQSIAIDVFQNYVNTFTLVNSNVPNADIISNCLGCTLGVKTETPFAGVVCTGQIPDPLERFQHFVHNIPPQGHFTFTFSTFKCCDDNSISLNQNKAFNHWQITGVGESGCLPAVINSIPAQIDPIVIAAPDAISSHHISFNTDINLDCSVVSGVNSMVIYPDVVDDPLRCDNRYSDYKNLYQVKLNGLIGDLSDLQVFGYDNTNDEVKLILRVIIHTEKGLVIDDGPNEAFITSINNSVIWNQISGSFHTTNTLNCCVTSSDYYFYFDISSLTGSGAQLIHDYFENGRLNFKFQACCLANSVTEYSVEFSVIMDKSCTSFVPGIGSAPLCSGVNCCFLPLSKTGSRIHVHCPGCKSPGAIVDNYYLQRISYGLPDSQDDHIADNTTPITPLNYGTSFNKINRNGAVFGDLIEDRMVGHFEPGYTDGTTSGGYTYHNMMTSNGIQFNALQVHKAIGVIDPQNPLGPGPDPTSLEVVSIDFFVDELALGNFCTLCDDFVGSNNQVTTIAQLTINSSDPDFNNFLEANSTDTEKMFIFRVSDILNHMVTGSTFIEFTEEQQYRIAVQYKVCGNFQSDNENYIQQDPLDRVRNTEFNNTLFFNGDGITLAEFENTVFQAPNNVSTILSSGLEFPQIPQFVCQPTPCPAVSQTNFGNLWQFYCEKFSAAIDFYSTTCLNVTLYRPISESCNKEVLMSSNVGIGGSATNNYFPFEYKPPAIFPYTYQFQIPSDFQLIPNLNNTLNMNSQVIGINSNGQTTFPASGYVQKTYTLSPQNFLTVDLPLNPQGSCVTALNPISNNTVNLFVGDEGFSHNLIINLEPEDCIIANAGIDYPVSDAVITFDENHSSCTMTSNTCDYEDIRDNDHWIRRFTTPNPNLEISFVDNGIAFASSNEICWNFTITNLPTIPPPGTPGFTEAVNLYVAIPDITPFGYLPTWTFNFTSQQNTPGSISTGSFSPPNNNGVFEIIPYLKNHSVAYISGKLCASYECGHSIGPIELKWGWNCDGYPDEITPDVCGVNTFDLQVVELPATISGFAHSTSTTGYNLCDEFTITTCFKSDEEGPVTPDFVELINFPATGLTLVTAPQINDCSLSSTPVQLNGNNYSWDVEGSQLGALGIGNSNDGVMQINDCFCMSFTFNTSCGYNGTLPSVLLHSQTYCSEPGINDLDTPLDLLPLNQLGTLCTDCFVVTKEIDPPVTSIASATEPITYHISVCSYNASSITASIDVWDIFPSFFTPIGTNPFGMDGPFTAAQCTLTGTDCCDYYVTGTITSLNAIECNDVFIGDATTDPYNPVEVGTAQACVTITPNCIDANTTHPIINPGGTSDAYTEFGCGVSPCPVSNKVIVVAGTLEIDDDMNFTDCIFSMEPGSEIIINTPATVTFSRTSFSACSKMWKGITLDHNSLLSFRDVDIQGAQYAIHSTGMDNIVLVNRSNFVSNYIGIYVPEIPNQSTYVYNNSVIFVAQSKFFGTGNLPMAYTGQTDLYGIQPVTLADNPLAGLHLTKISNLFIGQDPLSTPPNEFTNMSNGIIGWRSNLTKIVNCKFVDINAQNAYANITNLASFGNSFNGSAIYGNGYKTSFAINQEGFGNNSTDPVTFDNCNFGIFADRISLISHNSRLKNVGTGYRAQLVKSGVDIYENRVDAREDGVQLLFCDGGGRPNEIWNNKILFGNNSNLTGPFAGIVVEEDLNQNVYSRIHNNDIYFGPSTSARYGIFANSTVPFEVTRNRISLADNSLDWDGIYMSNCEKSNVSCNVISANGNLPIVESDPSAIKYFMGNGPIIACNAMNNTPNGIFVIGQINVTHNLEIKFNEFNNHFIGLRYGANTIAAAQELKGNLWFNAAPIGGIQARNDNNNPNYFIDYYTYANNPNPPPGATFLPSLLPANNGWFVFDLLGSNESCYSPSNFCNTYFPIVSLSISELELKIAKDSIENNPYSDETSWMMKKGLFEKLYNNPDLLFDSTLAAFYFNMLNSFIAQLNSVEHAKSILFLKDSTNVVNLLQFEINLDYSMTQLMEQLGFLASTLENNANTGSIITEIITIQSTISAIISTRDSLATLYDSQRIDNADITQIANNQLTTSAIIETNEKTVNEVSLSTIGKDNLHFTTNQIENLHTIAEQCPLSGGSAVFRARAMLYLIEGKLDYNDRAICWSEGIELKVHQNGTNRNSTAKIYPNPANENVTIEYAFEGLDRLEFSLYTSTGKRIMNKDFAGGNNSYNFSTSQLLPGVYHVELKGSNVPSFNGKLVIIR